MTQSKRYRKTLALAGWLLLGVAACGGGSNGGGRDNDAGNDESQPSTTPNQPPTARFSASEVDGFSPLTVTFDAAASRDPDGRIASYRWTFGDESSASGSSVSHTFNDTGRFDITLEITDDGGLTDTATESLRVRGATVSGVIRVAAGTSVDSDVNDRLTDPVSNNGFGEAQPVRNPLRLGGFVNLPGTGEPDGNFRAGGDQEDIFAVGLEGDERILLSIGDPSADLDLELYDDAASPELLDASVSQDPQNDATEDLSAPEQPGNYFVRVVAVQGASTYVLSIEDDVAPRTLRRRAKRLSDPFVPGEVLVARAGRATTERLGVRPARAGTGMRLEALDRGGISEPELRVPEFQPAEGATVSAARRSRYQTLIAARHLGGRSDVAISELNVLRRAMRAPDDPFYNRQWHFRAIGLEQAWNVTTGDVSGRAPVVVAVVDTGLLLDHPDLRNQLLRDAAGRVVGYDFIQNPSRANDGDGIDPNPRDPGDEELGPNQGSFHGTHVAGTVAAQSNNGVGVAGVSWHARIMPVRALGIDGGTTFDVLQAVRYAARLDNVSGTLPPVRADIINMSLGSDFYSQAEQQALNQVRARGVFVVASAGNEGTNVPSYPAAYNGVIAVAATDGANRPAFYSNFGPQVDIAAPGGNLGADADGDGRADGVASTIGTGGRENIEFGYGLLDGTSMAAPHVSGTIALMKSVYPELTPGEFDVLLRNGRLTRDAGPQGRDNRFGWGIVDAHQAVLAAQGLVEGEFGPIISTTTTILDFQAFTGHLEFGVTNTGDLPAVVDVHDDAPWLTVVPVTPTDNGFGEYRATVDRTGLADGTYRATIRIEARNTERVQPVALDVIMQVVSPHPDADAGQHYVLLVSPGAEEPRPVQGVTATNGEYRFELRDVPAGEYHLFAGTDLDDDDIICGGGEACGAFPSLGDPEIIRIDPGQQPEVNDLSFASEFRTTATITAEGRTAAGGEGGLAIEKAESH